MGGAWPLVSRAGAKSPGFGIRRARLKSWLGHSLCLGCGELHYYLSGHVLNCLTGCRGTGTYASYLMGPMGLGIKIFLAVFPVLTQSKAKEKTQDGLMLPSGLATCHMALAMRAGSLSETVVGKSLGSQLRTQQNHRDLLCGPG